MKTQTPQRKKKLGQSVKSLPRETLMSKSDKNKSIDIMRHSRVDTINHSLHRMLNQLEIDLRDSKREVRKLKKKVDQLHATIGFLLTQ